MVRAIVILGRRIPAENRGGVSSSTVSLPRPTDASDLQSGLPLACVEVLGRSVLERVIDELRHSGIDAISVLAPSAVAAVIGHALSGVTVRGTEDAWTSAERMLSHPGGPTVILSLGPYVEFDLSDMLQVHQLRKYGVSRARANGEPLDIWIVSAGIADQELATLLYSDETSAYPVRGYVNQLESPSDLRSLVIDAFNSRCHVRPQGIETRPGVWIEDNAFVNRDARIVAPAYIGRSARVEAQCLITRCSNVESNCHIDYGTVVEDSSILANTYVGIGLDLSHSIADGNNLLNLDRDVALHISDPCVIRQNRVSRKEVRRPSVAFGLGEPQFAEAEERSTS